MDHLTAIRVFARVVEAGNFTRAADSLRMPKATVTKLVQHLEGHLRVKLLQRTTRRVTVTPEGAAYYERTHRLLNELEEVESGLAHAQATPRGGLRVGVSAAIARLILLPALPSFHARYPGIVLDLGITDRPFDLIGDQVDCAIRCGEAADSSLVGRRIGSLSWVTCATPAYLEQYGVPQHPRDLERGYPLVSYLSALTGRPAGLRFKRGEEQLEVAGQSVLVLDECEARVIAGRTGLGLIQTLRYLAQPDLDRGELVPVLAEWEPEPMPVHVLHPPGRHLSAKLRAFVDWSAEPFRGVR